MRVKKDLDCIYRKWNGITAMCYSRRMICKGCNNTWACAQGEKYSEGNKYKMRMIKYAVLRTYANIGKKGIEKFLNVPEHQTNQSGFVDVRRV